MMSEKVPPVAELICASADVVHTLSGTPVGGGPSDDDFPLSLFAVLVSRASERFDRVREEA